MSARTKMRRTTDGKLRKVVTIGGIEGFVERGTDSCTGCTEYGDYGAKSGPFGCSECGYTGKRVREWWTPFDIAEWEAKQAKVHPSRWGEGFA